MVLTALGFDILRGGARVSPVLAARRSSRRRAVVATMKLIVGGRNVGAAARVATAYTEGQLRMTAGLIAANFMKAAYAAVLSTALLSSTLQAPALAADIRTYDGFAEYAADGNKMEETDVNCLIGETQCRAQTFACFSGQEQLGGTGDLSCLKGVVCLGRCKGEQKCATQCFAQYGSSTLDNWLSCAIEDQKCVKVQLHFAQAHPHPCCAKTECPCMSPTGAAFQSG
eukprot:6206164-Pleurochrysis_carterae.AAC.2